MRRRLSARLARRWFHDLRLEGSGRGSEAAAMGVGVFIGCLPFYGLHLPLVYVVGRVLRLNRLKMYVAANISNPFLAPVLIMTEVQAGAFFRRQQLHELTVVAIRSTDPWVFGADLLLGSLLVGALLGGLIAAVIFAAVALVPPLSPHVEETFAAAADRYLERGITAWEFARGKLRQDPVYRSALTALPPATGTLADIGCGQGLLLAVLIEARATLSRRRWPDDVPPPPAIDRLVGIETRGRIASIAREALGGSADVVHARAPDGLPAGMSAAVLIDVLHLMPREEQERLMGTVFTMLPAGGVVLVREVNADGGWGYHAVRLGNRLKAIAVGRWRQRFHFRSATAWTDLFTERGWSVESWPMAEGTPFANVLFRLVKPQSPHVHPVAGGHSSP